ncbi:MAG TPA: pyridoxine 5'-phosphate synthase [Victivallales bacterium]|nr:pyridoxine 5'-phosphate synthase [Victivallales bacterium]
MLKLGVNVDHVATVRQARRASLPSPLEAAMLAEKGGADGITAHLREDRRHIQDIDMTQLADNVKSLNMEMAVTEEMVGIACRLKPENCCLVPEKRAELTTEGGLDVLKDNVRIKTAVSELKNAGITVSIFIDPEFKQIEAAADTGATFIELHTGTYSLAGAADVKRELNRLIDSAKFASGLGLKVNAGHGIDYLNIDSILEIPNLVELNIGHSIVARAVICGFENAVREMKNKMLKYKN